MFSPKKYTWWYIGNAVRSEITQIGIMQNLIRFPSSIWEILRREYSIERKSIQAPTRCFKPTEEKYFAPHESCPFTTCSACKSSKVDLVFSKDKGIFQFKLNVLNKELALNGQRKMCGIACCGSSLCIKNGERQIPLSSS